MMITRPAEGSRHVTYPYRLGSPPVFSQMAVGSEEAAVFRKHHAVLGVLGPGRHSLSPTGAPFLERTKSNDGQRYEVDLVFVTTGLTRLGLDGPVGTLTDISGHPAEFLMMGAATVTTRDPVRVVSQGIGVGEAGDAFDQIVVRRLMAGITRELPKVLERGLASPGDLPGVGAAILDLGRADQLSVDVLGLEVRAIEVARLVSRQGRPVAGSDASARRAQVAADAELPKNRSARFGATRIPFWDTQFNLQVHVSAVGHFEGDEIPPHLEQWLSDAITQTLRGSATSWQGTVLDLVDRKDEWARYATQVVAPQVAQYTRLRGRVVIDAIEIAPQELQELKRRRAAAMMGGR
jgi:hypothetical protein